MTEVIATSVVALFSLRRLRHRRNTTAAIMERRASEPPTIPPITAPEILLGLEADVGEGVKEGELVGVLLAVENAVGSGTLDDSATFRSWK